MELLSRGAGQALRVVYEILKKVPKDCPSKAVAVGASALLVVASAVMARLAVTSLEDVARVREEDVCGQCDVKSRCQFSRAR